MGVEFASKGLGIGFHGLEIRAGRG